MTPKTQELGSFMSKWSKAGLAVKWENSFKHFLVEQRCLWLWSKIFLPFLICIQLQVNKPALLLTRQTRTRKTPPHEMMTLFQEMGKVWQPSASRYIIPKLDKVPYQDLYYNCSKELQHIGSLPAWHKFKGDSPQLWTWHTLSVLMGTAKLYSDPNLSFNGNLSAQHPVRR